MGTERDASYYDGKFLATQSYQQHYSLSPYLALWRFVYFQAIQRFVAPRVLDLGCGPGQFADMLREFGVKSYRGLDFSEVAVARGVGLCPDYEFQVRDLRTLTPSDFAGFDIVSCLETLEHIQEDLSVLSSVPSGLPVVISVPRKDCESHVRFFPQKQHVLERYTPLLSGSSVFLILNRWWVLMGKRK